METIVRIYGVVEKIDILSQRINDLLFQDFLHIVVLWYISHSFFPIQHCIKHVREGKHGEQRCIHVTGVVMSLYSSISTNKVHLQKRWWPNRTFDSFNLSRQYSSGSICMKLKLSFTEKSLLQYQY